MTSKHIRKDRFFVRKKILSLVGEDVTAKIVSELTGFSIPKVNSNLAVLRQQGFLKRKKCFPDKGQSYFCYTPTTIDERQAFLDKTEKENVFLLLQTVPRTGSTRIGKYLGWGLGWQVF